MRDPDAPHNDVYYLKGEVGADIRTLQLLYHDGVRETIPITHHWVFFQLDPGRFAGNHQPDELIAHDRTGRAVYAHYVSW